MGLNKRTARISGLLWLLMSVTGLFSQMGFREKVFVTGDMLATSDHILSNQFLFRMGFVCDLLMLIFYLLTGLALYRLFETVNKHQVLLMGIFVILGTAIGMMNLLNEFASLQILSNEAYHKVLGEVSLQAQAMISYDLYEHGYVIADIFFSLWVLPLGVLIYKSGFIPRIFGIFFMIETVLGLLSVALHFLYPNTSLETNLLWAAAIAEFSFMFWLLIRGINEAGVNRGGVISNHPRPV